MIAIFVLAFMVLGGTSGSKIRQLTFGAGTEAYPVVSPNGQWLAYERLQDDDPDGTEIWVMSMSGGFLSARRVSPKGQFSSGPSWSRDSHWISFAGAIHLKHEGESLVTYQLYKTNIETGELIQLTHTADKEYDIGVGAHPVWSHNGWIAFERHGDIYGVREDGGPVVLLLKVSSAELPNREVTFLGWSPDSKRIAFDVKDYPASGGDKASPQSAPEYNAIWVGDIDSGSIRRVSPSPWDMAPQWIDADRLVFARASRDKAVNICILNFSTGKISKLTSGYIDWLPHVTPDGLSLVFSRVKEVPEGHGFNFLFGSHIVEMPIPHSSSSPAWASRDNK